jgi:uncharacterized membrane protein YagU involved in acid resistance
MERLKFPRIKHAHPFTGIFAGALVAGATIEIFFLISMPYLLHGFSPLEVLQWDAANVLGQAAFSQGIASALAGVVMHFLVSIVWATLYVFGLGTTRAAELHPAIAGAIFGVIVWFVMTFLVLPLGAGPHLEVDALSILNGVFAHVVCFGIPLALVVSRVE